jgi:hypothetical protein
VNINDIDMLSKLYLDKSGSDDEHALFNGLLYLSRDSDSENDNE